MQHFFRKCLPLLGILLIYSTAIFAQKTVYSEVEVQLPEFAAIQSLADQGFDIDHYRGTWEEGIRFFVTQDELAELNSLGYEVTVTIPDFSTYYTERQIRDRRDHPHPQKTRGVASGFDLGSMGGFYTFDEVVDKLDEMRTEYPNLISEKQSIGTTLEGRNIWMAKISDHPDMNENEPAAHFDALHHAREPLSMAATVNFMYYLLENYETDQYVKNLVDTREIYFVPVVNPDGYVFNEMTNPNGGGLWRKNRNPNSGGCVGVDLNRNYSFGYANDPGCSSDNPCSGVYRGAEAFSEEESKAIRDLLSQTGANTAFSTHSTAGTYLMPYGFDTSPPAFDIYSEWASTFLADNDYPYGVTSQMLGYTSCGTTRDYMHSEEIYGWTPEIDGDGFWPPESTIFDLVAENVRPFLFQSYIAGAYLDVQSHRIMGDVLPGAEFELEVAVKNIGIGDAANSVSVIVQANSPDVISPTAGGFGNIAAREVVNNAAAPFTFSVSPDIETAFFTITITTIQDGLANESIDIPVLVGAREVLFEDDAEGTAANWSAYGNGNIEWGVILDDSYSGLQSFGDSDNGNGQNGTETFFELNPSFDFTSTNAPRMEFAYKHALPSPDRVQLQSSVDNGVNWNVMEEYTENEAWSIASLNLSGLIGASEVKFRFALLNNPNIPGDGFYFDDFSITDYNSDLLATEAFYQDATNISPNPFTGSFNILHVPEGSDMKLSLFDALGRSIRISTSTEYNSIKVHPLQMLTPGVYFLVITNPDNQRKTIRRLIKE